ncbi:hypothetical protein GDO81_004027 [Engystomops pustulosus]|uniref:Secreted protein n=1 Tax=Engystomops pustulosus TaxID=76066 RepID=A0AAV6ZPG9_ENGPU|nr:hypothetical protein GDO81_004027 [Engystomops pustulosus]
MYGFIFQVCSFWKSVLTLLCSWLFLCLVSKLLNKPAGFQRRGSIQQAIAESAEHSSVRISYTINPYFTVLLLLTAYTEV